MPQQERSLPLLLVCTGKATPTMASMSSGERSRKGRQQAAIHGNVPHPETGRRQIETGPIFKNYFLKTY
jgi:hypothetical protein